MIREKNVSHSVIHQRFFPFRKTTSVFTRFFFRFSLWKKLFLFARDFIQFSTRGKLFREDKIQFPLPWGKNETSWKHMLMLVFRESKNFLQSCENGSYFFGGGKIKKHLVKTEVSFPPSGKNIKTECDNFSFTSHRNQHSCMHDTANSVIDLDMYKQWCSKKFWQRMPILILCTGCDPFWFNRFMYTLDLICILSFSLMNRRFICCICSIKSLFVSLHGKFNN